MTADSTTSDSRDSAAAPTAVVRKRKGFQVVWVIPMVAALVGGWLWYRALQDKGPEITITFATADGLEAGKTKIKFKDLEIGEVSGVTLADNMEHVIASVELVAGSERYLTDQTRFWVVRPRIGAGGISGLGTIVSGAYIAADVSLDGTPAKAFTGLEEPPARPANAEGLRVKLRSPALGSINTGTSITHLQIKMGDVEGYTYLRDEELIEFDLYIEAEYAELVRENTRFWSASGFDVTLGTDGFDIHADSLESILMGGIAFGSAPNETPGQRASAGHVFTLYDSKSAAGEISNNPRRTIAYFNEPIRGLAPGSPVDFQGIVIGKVLEVGVAANRDTGTFMIPVVLETYPDRLMTTDNADTEEHGQILARLVERGLRAQLGPANLVTGARSVLVDLHPDTPATLMGHHDDGTPEIPTIPSTGEALTKMLDELPQIVSGLNDTVNTVSELVSAPRTAQTLDSLNSASAQLDQLLRGSDTAMNLLATNLPAMQQQLSDTLHELALSMRSLASLTDFLERHPEALLRGKSASGDL
ncbi:MAG: paraquat-inducible protein B [Planctomycetota bacterium]|nr:MAG: paraquat-inducible protein B [Planctomycetota bacterium]